MAEVIQVTLAKGAPTSATVVLTAREAAFLVRWIGGTNHIQRNEIQSDGGEVGSDIYDALDDSVFAAFYEDGVNGVPR